jgi:hypothetical protein
MANTLKKGAAQLKELAGASQPVAAPVGMVAPKQPKITTKKAANSASETSELATGNASKDTVLIGAHFPRAVRRSLAQLQADPRNDGKKINDLLAEALNDLFAKYNVPQTANLGRD